MEIICLFIYFLKNFCDLYNSISIFNIELRHSNPNNKIAYQKIGFTNCKICVFNDLGATLALKSDSCKFNDKCKKFNNETIANK